MILWPTSIPLEVARELLWRDYMPISWMYENDILQAHCGLSKRYDPAGERLSIGSYGEHQGQLTRCRDETFFTESQLTNASDAISRDL